eukprot:CAMPEP_0178960358 /NCGR_PEP_ID=MMETSP0789-20121207/12917_1 /TAXON_ID=3005 /ORGANISM="Rhizosolenia setigera, Strain CCMP 1694" /LENGTH=234 /DNA_ID=CAMNT_0020643693 /DNA_START=133 /DNA_END=837 /DNA_ORIENTATION=-
MSDSDNDSNAGGETATPSASANRAGLNPESARLFRVYKTIAAMLKKRDYSVPREMLEMTPLSFTQKFGEDMGVNGGASREALTILVEKADDPNSQLFVFFPEDEKVGVKPIKDYTERMRENDVTNAILILRVGMTPIAKQAVMEVSDSVKIEHFQEAELLVDITEHKLVPNHQVLTQNEKQELLNRYRLKDSQLPRIQSTDPVARYYGMRRGQVVKITRTSETAGRYVTYRICM